MKIENSFSNFKPPISFCGQQTEGDGILDWFRSIFRKEEKKQEPTEQETKEQVLRELKELQLRLKASMVNLDYSNLEYILSNVVYLAEIAADDKEVQAVSVDIIETLKRRGVDVSPASVILDNVKKNKISI
jgi:hypothetical protein